jgi:hypothetical protein
MNNYKASHKKRNQKQFNNYMYSPSNNDYDLQNRINKSLYPYKTSQRTSTINNISDYNYNSDSNYDLIEDFKDTLRKTQLLKDELINKNTFYKGNFNINYKYNKKIFYKIFKILNDRKRWRKYDGKFRRRRIRRK